MFGLKTARAGRAKDEAEKPFWISFSDLMTSLMVLFLVTMAASLISVTKGIRKETDFKEARRSEISACQNALDELKQEFTSRGIAVERAEESYTLNFGRQALFNHDSHSLDPQQGVRVRQVVKEVISQANGSKACQHWLKQIIVEGFASEKDGSYLYNLNLSYLRSQRILCVLLDAKPADALNISDRQQVAQLFMAGGSSFNRSGSKQLTEEQQRRVELRLEFKGQLDEAGRSDIGADRLKDPQCPNDLP